MTIIATIHQPSGDIFNLFDRLIVLHDGYTVYQGPIKGLSKYFNDLGIDKIGKFTNLADYVIKLSQAPHACLKGLTHQKLYDFYN